MKKTELIFCKCGCGRLRTKQDSQKTLRFYIGNHYTKSIQHKNNVSKFFKGKDPWNKGKQGLYHHSEETIKKFVKSRLGYSHSEETKRKIGLKNSISLKGRTLSLQTKNKLSLIMKKKLENKDYKKRLLNHLKTIDKSYWKGKKISRELIKKRLHRRIKSSLEIKFEQIIKKNNLPYKFVGNGDFFIERKNPDFINTNGEKIAVEVFYRRHKSLIFENNKFKKIDYSKLTKWKLEREKIFSRYGWKLIFFDETQVNNDNILWRLG